MSNMTQMSPTLRGAVASYIRREVLTWPNAATTVRVFCTFGIFARSKDAVLVLALALVGATSDAVDGYLAKKFGQCTQFGKRYDQYADGGFGVALMYAIVEWEGFTANNFLLTLIIGIYFGARMLAPTADTNEFARTKTMLQFTGGVSILGSHALAWPLLQYAGYVIVWISMIWTWWSFKAYLREALKNRRAR